MGQLTLFDCSGSITLNWASRPKNVAPLFWSEQRDCVLIGGHRGRHKDKDGRYWGRSKGEGCQEDIGLPSFEWEI